MPLTKNVRIFGRMPLRSHKPMQTGDVPTTWAHASLLNQLTGYKPQTDHGSGVAQFVV